MRRLILFFLYVFNSTAYGFPEFSGDGYFSCTSCHISSSGGDTLTSYGRSFAEHKLVWKAYEGEAAPLHGAVKIPDWLLLGGHARLIQIHYEDSRAKEGRFFNMQRSFDLGFTGAGFFSTVSFSQKRKDTYDYDANSVLLDRFLIRYDILESLSVRYGILVPKFGLNVSDHNAYVRSKMGLGVGTEEGLADLSWFSESIEVNVSHSAKVPPNDVYIDQEKTAERNNLYGNISFFLAEKHRLSTSALLRTEKNKDRTQQGVSLAAAVARGENFRYTIEGNTVTTLAADQKSTISNLYSQLTLWTLRGLYPGLRYEQTTEKKSDSLTRADKIALNISFHPRPHFEFSGSLGLRRDLETFTFGHSGFLMFHYWL